MTSAPRIARASLAVTSLCLLLFPARALAAQGMNLAWVHCMGDGGVQNQAFACNTNSATHLMHGSFVLASDFPDVIGTEIILQLAADSPGLPAWWDFRNAGTCRQSAFAAFFTADAANVVCEDWSNGQMVGGLGAYCTVAFPCLTPPPGANVAVIKVINAVPMSAAAVLTAGVEYYDFTLVISNTKTVGAGSCAGCTTPVCIVLNSINVVDAGNLHPRMLTTPTAPGSNFATWQGGGSPVVGGVIGCPAATPTKRSTWGSMKSLYR
jgi:hypothetical protein